MLTEVTGDCSIPCTAEMLKILWPLTPWEEVMALLSHRLLSGIAFFTDISQPRTYCGEGLIMWISFSKAAQDVEERIELCWYVDAMLYLTHFWWLFRYSTLSCFPVASRLWKDSFIPNQDQTVTDRVLVVLVWFCFSGFILHCPFMPSLIKEAVSSWCCFYWPNDGWYFWRCRYLLQPQDYLLSERGSITHGFTISVLTLILSIFGSCC